MRSRKLRWVLDGLTLALLAVGAFLVWPREDRITQTNFARIREGMTRADVEAILGPPGEYDTRPTPYWKDWGDSHKQVVFDEAEFWRALNALSPTQEWSTDTALIKVLYDRSGTTVAAEYWVMRREPTSPLDDLLWRVQQTWRRWFP